MKDKWTLWSPLPCIVERYDIDRYFQNRYGFHIVLDGKNTVMRIVFQSPIGGYRFAGETNRFKFISEEYEKQNEAIHKGNTDFLKIENSSYIASLMLVPGNSVSKNQLTHYVVSDDNYIIDIAAFEDPIVTIVD